MEEIEFELIGDDGKTHDIIKRWHDMKESLVKRIMASLGVPREFFEIETTPKTIAEKTDWQIEGF